jgi:hypothetical protein
MNTPVPELDDLRNLFERFRRAGWITDVVVSGEEFSPEFTPLGLRRLKSLVENFADIRAAGFEFTSLAAGEARDCVAELLPPNFPPREIMALFGFIKLHNLRK